MIQNVWLTALSDMKDCLNDGIDLKGYLVWSLLDNCEWQKGFGMQFGLIGVDREHDYQRQPRESLYVLGRALEK